MAKVGRGTPLGNITVTLTVSMTKFKMELEKAATGIKRFASTVKAVMTKTRSIVSTVMGGIGKMFNAFGITLKRVQLAVTAYIVASIKNLADFTDQLGKVSTMLTDQTRGVLPQYAAMLKTMAVTYGESTKTLSDGLYAILSASIPASKALDVLRVSVEAARAGFTDTATAAFAITGAMNAYGQEVYTAGQLSDMMFQIQKRGQTSFAQFAPVLGTLTSEAAAVGMKFEEVAAALANVTRNGIPTERAVTSLRNVFAVLQGQTEEAVAVAEKYGVTLSWTELRTKGLVSKLGELRNLHPEILKDIFKERRARLALNVLLSNYEELIEDVAATTDAAGSRIEAFDEVVDTLGNTLRRLWQTIKIAGQEALAPFTENIKEFVKTVIDNRHKFSQAMSQMVNRLVWFGEVFAGVVKLLQDDWREGVNVIKGIFVETLKAMAIVGVDLAIRIGRGIAEGIVAGFKRAWASKKSELKGILRAIGPAMPGVGALGALIGKGKSEGEAVEAEKEVAAGVLEGFGELAAAAFAEAGKNIRELNTEFTGVLDQAGANFAKREKEFVDGMKEAKDAAQDLKEATETDRQGGGEVGTGEPQTLADKQADAEDKAFARSRALAAKWKQVWSDVSETLASSMQETFADIVEDVGKATESINDMLRSVQRELSKAVFRQYLMKPAFAMLGAVTGLPLQMPGQTTPVGPTKEFTNQPQAMTAPHGAKGLYIPKGADRVPVMAGPGEWLMNERLTSGVKQALEAGGMGGGGGVTNVTVQAIDSKGVYEFINGNKRAFATAIQSAQTRNHPSRRQF